MPPIGKFYAVNPRGTYLKPLRPGDSADRPTVITIAELRLEPGDYLGLEQTGSFHSGGPYPRITNLIGVFRRRSGRALAPMSYGTEIGERTQIADISQDFALWGQQNIVRVPTDAHRLEFTTNDVYFSDNRNDNNFGVLVTKPNSPPDEAFTGTAEWLDDHAGPDCGPGEPNPETAAYIARFMAEEEPLDVDMDPVGMLSNPVPMAQYRGWYPVSSVVSRSRWITSQSKYLGRNGTHKGVDIFAPQGTPVLAPVAGEFVPNAYDSSGPLGKNGIIIYRRGNKRRHCVLAHLQTVTASAGSIRAGQMIGTAGCTGNAETGNPAICGIDRQNPCGGRSDHVHIDVREGTVATDSPVYLDPVAELRMSIQDTGSQIVLCGLMNGPAMS